MHVLVTPPRQVDEQQRPAPEPGREHARVGQRVARLERRDEALQATELTEGVQRVLVVHRDVPRAAALLEEAVLWSDARVIYTGGDAVRSGDLPPVVLEDVAARPVQDAHAPAAERRGVSAEPRAATPGFDADQFHAAVIHEACEEADRVAAAANAGKHRVGQAPLVLQYLGAGFAADDRLEVAHDR